MKKFFALMLVVAMLSVAGSAMAVTISVSGDKTVSVQAGKSAGFTLVVSLDHSDELKSLSVDISSGTAGSWATSITSSEVTFAVPSTTTAGTYPAVVRARERWISGDTTGHSIQTDTATVRVSLDVTVAPAPTPDKKSEVVTNVKVMNINIAVVPTFSSQSTIPSAITTALATPATQNVVRNVLTRLGISVPAGATVQAGSNMVAATTDNYDNSGTAAANQANLAKGAAKLKKMSGGDTKRAAGVPAPFRPNNSGFQPIDVPVIDKVLYDYPLGMVMNATLPAPVGGQFAASDASGNSEVAFLNSLGQSVDKVPNASGSWDAGKVTAIAYVEAGALYEPILTVTVSPASADSFDEASGTTTVSQVEIIEPADVTPVDSGDVFPSGKNFTVHVGEANKAALASLTGLSLDEIPVTTVSSDQTRSGDLYIGTTYVEEVALIPRLQNLPASAAGHGYVAAFKYDKLVNSRTIISSPLFIPDWTNGNAVGGVYAITGTTTKAARDAVSGDVYTGNTGYLVFRVSGDTIAFAAADASFADPRLVAASATTTPSTDYPEGTSSSSGGCSAGSAALALAVLGSFILTRKK